MEQLHTSLLCHSREIDIMKCIIVYHLCKLCRDLNTLCNPTLYTPFQVRRDTLKLTFVQARLVTVRVSFQIHFILVVLRVVRKFSQYHTYSFRSANSTLQFAQVLSALIVNSHLADATLVSDSVGYLQR